MPGELPGRGGALLASEALNAGRDESNVLLTVPKDLVLSLERCQEQARYDRDYRGVLDSLGDFGKVGPVRCRNVVISMHVHVFSLSASG